MKMWEVKQMKFNKYCVVLFNPHLGKNQDGEYEESSVFIDAVSRRDAIRRAKMRAKVQSGLAGWRLFPCDANVMLVA